MNKKTCLVNDRTFILKDNYCSLDEIVKKIVGINKKYKSLAVSVNERIIHKSDWSNKKIKVGDRIEIVQPFFGG